MHALTRVRQLTLEQFAEWLYGSRADIRVDPHVIVRCTCRDVNCRGWRLVSPDEAP